MWDVGRTEGRKGVFIDVVYLLSLVYFFLISADGFAHRWDVSKLFKAGLSGDLPEA